MVHIQWKDRYNIHFREIDAQHRGLLDMLNELLEMVEGQPEASQVLALFEHLGNYASTHFTSEERYMQAAGYPKLAEHRLEHDAFTARIEELAQGVAQEGPRALEQARDFLKHWYLEHITRVDQDYAPFLKRALPTAAIEGILLGFEGALGSFDFTPFLQMVGTPGSKEPEVVRAYLWGEDGPLAALERGSMDAAGAVDAIRAWAGGSPAEPVLAESYAASFHPAQAMLKLAENLGCQHRVGVAGTAAPWIIAALPLVAGEARPVRSFTWSFEKGSRSPDPAILVEATARLGIAPAACLFIHRDPGALDQAHSVGFQTLQFTNPVLLMAELRRMAIPF